MKVWLNMPLYFLVYLVFLSSIIFPSFSYVTNNCSDVTTKFKEKEDEAESQFIEEMNALIGGSNTSSQSDLYSSLSLNLNVSESSEGFENFTKAFDQITDSYFKACFGPDEERPNIHDTPEIKKELLSLLRNHSDIETVRIDWGKLSCLETFENDNQSKIEFPCESSTDINTFYQCLDPENISCIFHLKSNCDYESSGKKVKRKHCLGFAVDTTGSMSSEINSAKQVVLNFLKSEEDINTLCYVLVPFNDYDYATPKQSEPNHYATCMY